MKFFNTPYFKYGSVLILLIGLLIYQCVVKHDKDFDIFIGASKLVFEGKTPYEVWLISGTSGLKYFYSPLFAVLLFPLKSLPQAVYTGIWMALNFAIIFRTFQLLSFFLPIKKLSEKNRVAFYILCFVCSVRFILDNLDLGQMTFLLVWGILESVRLIYLKKTIWAAALLALITNIKIIPIAVLPWLIYKKEFRVFLLTILFIIVFIYLPAIFVGFNFNNTLLHDWFLSLSGTNANSIVDDLGRPSLSSLVPSLLMDTEIQFGVKRNFLSLSADTVKLILTCVRISILIFLTILFGKPFQKITNKKTLFYNIALICLVTPLIFPHQGKYSFFYVLPAYAFCIYSLIKLHSIKNNANYKKIYLGALVFVLLSFAGITLTTDGVIGRRLSDVTEYLHFITYGAICLLMAMAFLKPKERLERRFL